MTMCVLRGHRISRVKGWLRVSRVKGWLRVSRVKGWLRVSRVKGWLRVSRVKGWLRVSRVKGAACESRHWQYGAQKIAQFRTHDLTKERSYVSTPQSGGYFSIDTEMM
jgi:hypothetical protein